MQTRSSYYNRLTIFLLFLIIGMNPETLLAQGDNMPARKDSDFKSKLFFGGGFGLQFGSVTLIEVSPLVGYSVTLKFGIGVSPTYKYYKYNDYYGPSNDMTTNVFGGSIFARYSIFENVFAHVEYESLFYNTKVPGYETTMQQFNSFFVGGGYNQRLGGRSAMYFLVLWNLIDTLESPYSNPVIRIGYSFGM